MNFRALFNIPIMELVLPLVLVLFAGLAALMVQGRRVNVSTPKVAKSPSVKAFRRAS